MRKFIVEVEDGMEVYVLSEDTKKLELSNSDEAYESAIYEALEAYGFDSIEVKVMQDT